MSEIKVTLDEKNKLLKIELPYTDDPKPSKSGKSMIVASTSGSIRTALKFQDKFLTIGVNAYITPDN